MTETPPLASNPFAFMLDPEAVLRAVEQSKRLPALRRRICRPLDKTQTMHDDDAAADAYDRAVDEASDAE